MPGSEGVSVIQGKDDDVVLLALETALELGMSKLLACCERYIALNPCNNFMAPNAWQRVPSSSTLRIAICLSIAMNYARHDIRIVEVEDFPKPYDYVPSCQRFLEMAE